VSLSAEPNIRGTQPVSPESVRLALQTILSADAFSGSERLRRFLQFLVERTLAGKTDDLKEYTIGLEVFDRDPSYDPRVDSTVRVHAGKLRDRLREYYLGQGKLDAVRIDIPKGTYVPVFVSAGPALQTLARHETVRSKNFWRTAVAIAVGVAAVIAVVIWTRAHSGTAPLRFHQLTFRRGMISSARFGPDNQIVVYSAAWEGKGLDVFSTRPGSPDTRSLGFQGAHLLAIGTAGEIAAGLNARYNGFFQFSSTLARASLSGGAPREMLNDVVAADWSRSGEKLVIARQISGHNQLELPPAHVIFEGPADAWIGDVRFAPDGNHIAFLVHPLMGDNLGSLFVTDLTGHAKKISGEMPAIQGVAWTPNSREIWFSGTDLNSGNALFGADLSGKTRTLWRSPDTFVLDDISTDGRALLTFDNVRLRVMSQPPGNNREVDMSWLEGGCSCGLSEDGKTLLIGESGIGGGPKMSVYLRPVNATTAVRLGDGIPLALSPDGAWVLAFRHDSPQRLVFLPTGVGETKTIPAGNIRFLERGSWFPDNRRVLLVGRELNRAVRTYVGELNGGIPKPLTPEGISGVLLSPGGDVVLVRDDWGNWMLFRIGDGSVVPAKGIEPGVVPVAWSNTPNVIYLRSRNIPAHLERVDLRTGSHEPWRELMPADPSGAMAIQHIQITPSGDSYAYTYFQFDSRLFIIEGLR
jgi:eukaryotic-like serine/threonine-protein kinase